MPTPNAMFRFTVAATLLVAAGSVQAANKAMPSDAQMIASAMRAAPASIAKGATIVAMDATGKLRTLRKGSNAFTCMPDSPATPGPDPMCMDKNAMAWAQAWMAHQPPPGKLGLMYMLEGGTDASNTNPFATKPEAGNHWIKTGPHLMLVGADDAFYAGYPQDANPDTHMPYVMWVGTPYQHLMTPIK